MGKSSKTVVSIAEMPPSMCFMKATAYLYGHSGSRREQQFRLKTKDDERNAQAFTGSDRGDETAFSPYSRAVGTELLMLMPKNKCT